MGIKDKLEPLDHAQQERAALAIPIATVKKFSEDKSAQMASMMAFWAFFSIFPLLLAGVTVLGYVLPEADKKRVLARIGEYFPLLDVSSVSGLQGSAVALVVGIATALWSGSAVVRATQDAFNSVWEVPQVERPKLLEAVLRSLLAMGTIGLGLLASTFLITFVTGDSAAVDLGVLGRVVGFAAAVVVDIGLFLLAFRMLTDRQVTTRDMVPGAVFAGVMFFILQSLSSFILTRHVSGAQETYGSFATVITILWWFYLQAQLTLLGAQLNVVLKREYYPRGLVNAPETEADHRLLEDFAEERQLDEQQDIDSKVTDRPAGEAAGEGADQRAVEATGDADRDARPVKRR